MNSLNKDFEKFFYRVEEIVTDIKAGKIIIIVDDKSQENEGVLFQAAEKVTQKSMNFFMTHGKGFIFLPCEGKRLKELGIPEDFIPLSLSIDARAKRGTGTSALDRVKTIKTFLSRQSKPADILMPGHIFPLKYHNGGVLFRVGHTEAAIDLAKIADLTPAGIICEIIKDDGEIALMADLVEISKKFNLKIITIEELIRYRKRKEKLIEKVAEVNMPTKWGNFKAITYRTIINPETVTSAETHVALVKGDVKGKKDVLVRVHSQCLTGDTFGSRRCDCGQQLDSAFRLINKNGSGVLLYMAQEGRGIGLCNKMKAYELQEKGLDTVEANLELGFEADMRDYGIGAQILSDLGLTTVHLMTNNPRKIIGLEGYGLKITKVIPVRIKPNENNKNYLNTKKTKLKHMLD
jgi:3,4-dihydroxy 2-butanone 4-phosphate synthase / GTP cyclohydrolase II